MSKANTTGKGTKRKRAATEGDDATVVTKDGPTIGQQTSQIGNKIVRSQKYAKLKHKKNVSFPVDIDRFLPNGAQVRWLRSTNSVDLDLMSCHT